MADPLPKHYPAREIERKWQATWDRDGTYTFDPDHPGRVFAVDTPPPTVSGLIHIGHVFSYTQAEILIRFRRMQGRNVFYPFGFDDNGLPSERFVEQAHGVRASDMTRGEFVQLCQETVVEAERQYEVLWRALGFSADWSQCYRTIDARARRISQRSFLDLLAGGHLARAQAPTLWCPTCRTALAQADLEERETPSHWHRVRFTETGGGEPIVVDTTRPELLPACVALIHHPGDERYRALTGREARVPYAAHTVPILADARAEPDKGTGIVMCCTFGDQTDIEWWRQFDLPYRDTFTPDGCLRNSGTELDGLPINEARYRIVALLEAEGELLGREPLQHPVKVHERCHNPVEFAISQQWFVKLLERKEELLAQADKVRWFPEYMKARYQHWVENLSWDWCISRQRYYGVPIPTWFCASCDAIIPADDAQLPVDPLVDAPPAPCPACGGSDYRPEKDVLDTWATSSVTPQINSRWGESDDRTGQLMPMAMRPQAHDIIRTWSFYTIVKALLHHGTIPWEDIVISGHVRMRSDGRGEEAGEEGGGRPGQDRKTGKSKGKGKGAAKSKLEKISKSRLQAGAISTPTELIEEWSADAVRYWTAGASLGADMAYDLKEMNQGKRFLTKLYNATKFALRHVEGYDGERPAELWPFDAWALTSFGTLVDRVGRLYDGYDFFHARLESEGWFWSVFCDDYLELVKGRLYAIEDLARTSGEGAAVGDAPAGDATVGDAPAKDATSGNANVAEITAGHRSGCATLYRLLLGIFRLFAPIVPHITEELYDRVVKPRDRCPSIHVDRFPRAADFPEDPRAKDHGDQAGQVLALVRRYKSTHQLKMSQPLALVEVDGLRFDPTLEPRLIEDLGSACRAATIRATGALGSEDVQSEGTIRIRVTPAG